MEGGETDGSPTPAQSGDGAGTQTAISLGGVPAAGTMDGLVVTWGIDISFR